MPLVKDTANISELKALMGDGTRPVAGFLSFVQGKKVMKASESLAGLKEQGYHAPGVLLVLLLLPLIGLANVHSFLNSELGSLSDAGKDVYYRLKNSDLIDWRKLYFGFVKEFLSKSTPRSVAVQGKNAQKTSPTCLILDDTIGAKTGSRIEGVGRLFDHVTGRYILGLKYLFLGYWDGSSFIPLDFSVHREKGKNAKKRFGLTARHLAEQFTKYRPEWTQGWKRHKELDSNKISAAIKLLKRAAKNGIKADYLLVDSWFACDELIKAVSASAKVGHLMGQCKNDARKYDYKGGKYSGGQLKVKLKDEWKRARSLNMRYLQVDVVYKGVPLRLFFTRQHGCEKERLLLTTDRSLNFTSAFEIYAIRWGIEVFFKEAKQLLGLGNCQSTDFDAQIAAATICMMQYTALAHLKRVGRYKTLGGLFKDCKQQAAEALLSERILASIVMMLTHLGDMLGLDWQEALGKCLVDHAYCTRMSAMLEALTSASPADHNALNKSA